MLTIFHLPMKGGRVFVGRAECIHPDSSRFAFCVYDPVTGQENFYKNPKKMGRKISDDFLRCVRSNAATWLDAILEGITFKPPEDLNDPGPGSTRVPRRYHSLSDTDKKAFEKSLRGYYGVN